MEKIKFLLSKLPYKTGIIITLLCIPFYILSFALPLYLDTSTATKGLWWFCLFGLAKTFQYTGLTILGGKGLFDYFKKKKMKKIIFVCHGNICRSPMAEYVMKNLIREKGLSSQYSISSAAVSNEEIGNDIHPGTKEILDSYNIPYSMHSAHKLSLKEYKEADLIILMDKSNLKLLSKIIKEEEIDKEKVKLLMSYLGENRDIADPWYTGDFEQSYDDIFLACKALLETLK